MQIVLSFIESISSIAQSIRNVFRSASNRIKMYLVDKHELSPVPGLLSRLATDKQY